MDTYEIAVLADDLHTKEERLRMMAEMNTPSDPELRRKSFIAYALAKAEVVAARKALDEAMER